MIASKNGESVPGSHVSGVEIIVACLALFSVFFLKFCEFMQVNVLALCICTKEAIKLMREDGIDDGHIIHLNR